MSNPVRTLLPAILLALLVSCGGSDGSDSSVGGAEPPVSQEQPPEAGSPPPESNNLDGDSQGLDSDSVVEEGIGFAEPNSVVRLEIDTLGAPLPKFKGKEYDIDTLMTLTVNGDEKLKTWGRIGVQGSSTADWPKKNWKLSFFADEERSEEISFSIGDSVASNKWIAKAEWIDPTMLRNAISYRLWEDIVQSRDSTKPMYEVDHAFDLTQFDNDHYWPIPVRGQGFPNNYPMRIDVNGEFYGLAILLMGHDPENFNIDKSNPNHIYMEFDARDIDSSATWERFRATNPDGGNAIGQWIELNYPKNGDITDEQKAAIDDLGDFLSTRVSPIDPGDLDARREQFEEHLNKTNMIDMLLFMEAIFDWDAAYNDIEIVTYDLNKWYFLPWDKDTTFGMWHDNSEFDATSSQVLVFNYGSESSPHMPWYKTYHFFTPEVEKRYADLRDEGVLSVANLEDIINGVDRMFSEEDRNAEEGKWVDEGRKSMRDVTSQQIIQWFDERLEMLDKHFGYNR